MDKNNNNKNNAPFACLLSPLVQQELRNKNSSDVLATRFKLMEEDTNLDLDKTVIDLTIGDKSSAAKFVDFSKELEVFDFCSSSATSLTSSLPLSEIMPHSLINSSSSSDSYISSAITNGHPGLPHLQLIGTLIRFNKRQGQQEGAIEPSIEFFLPETWLRKSALFIQNIQTVQDGRRRTKIDCLCRNTCCCSSLQNHQM